MLLTDAEQRGRSVIEAHYDALIVELFGARASGFSRDRLESLVQSGYLNIEALSGVDTSNTGLEEPLNPILFVRRLGSHYAEADSKTREQMRQWDLQRWASEMERPLTRREPKADVVFPTIDRPQPLNLTPPPQQRAVPSYFGPAEKAGLVSAFQVAGGFIRGLGASYADEFSSSVYEEWNGEELLSTPDPVRRADKLRVIREEVGTAVLTKDTARDVALRIRQRVGDLARDFERIAETELQAVHNEGQIYQAVELDGEGARVARIPESGACGACIRLFIDPVTNEPFIFSVGDLASNGTNVGRPKRSWVPTAFPVHPHCRCDTIPVGPDQKVTKVGRLVKR